MSSERERERGRERERESCEAVGRRLTGILKRIKVERSQWLNPDNHLQLPQSDSLV
jgi:hypothetical protein